ncbi:MAG: 7-carboxy-7-deazaguanine synthase QueE [Candidatus Cloacimonetes bacterium HGW-Cloacimonetes-3]|jgi:7-carboxy-7-deazaguanine synthase|nr:MAG: 7-carboxy-7-deazaguanine synthase QueE [Candidatus Cloacimonetes bacterium HGW-Cloacimonetes-3]
MEKHLNINEIFYSLQGESSFAGYPCVFIRLAECNLRCSYCDTQYAFGKGKSQAISSIMEQVKAYPCRLVEITGGEPMLQDDVAELFPALHVSGYKILLETNGSIYLGDVPDYVIKIVDVKTPGSGVGESFMKWNLKCLTPQDELKFVLTGYHDYRFALDFIDANLPKVHAIHFSPVQSLLHPNDLAAWMLEDGVNAKLSLQLHKLLQIP